MQCSVLSLTLGSDRPLSDLERSPPPAPEGWGFNISRRDSTSVQRSLRLPEAGCDLLLVLIATLEGSICKEVSYVSVVMHGD